MTEPQFGADFDASSLPAFQARAYIADVRAQFDQIVRSQAGRALAVCLKSPDTHLLILPYQGAGCNAQTWEDVQGPMIQYTPGNSRGSACAKHLNHAASLPHEILYHELVHAFRRRTGFQKTIHSVGGGLAEYGDSEEFLAIVVTNIFISDTTNGYKSRLRGAWKTHAALERDLSTSFGFFASGSQTFGMIARFCEQNRNFTHLLSQVPARFNPIAAYKRDPDRCFHIAATSERDVDAVYEDVAYNLQGRSELGEKQWQEGKER